MGWYDIFCSSELLLQESMFGRRNSFITLLASSLAKLSSDAFLFVNSRLCNFITLCILTTKEVISRLYINVLFVRMAIPPRPFGWGLLAIRS